MTWIINFVRLAAFLFAAVVATGCATNDVVGPVPEWAEDLSYSITCHGSESSNPPQTDLETPYASRPTILYDYTPQDCGDSPFCTVAVQAEVREIGFDGRPIVNDPENDQEVWLVLHGLSRSWFDLECSGSVIENIDTPSQRSHQAFGGGGQFGRLGVMDAYLGANNTAVGINDGGNNNPVNSNLLLLWNY